MNHAFLAEVHHTAAFARSAPLVKMQTARLDVSDPAIKEAIRKVRSDADPETFLLLGYEGKAKIVLKACGTGNAYACVEDMDESEVSYALLRITGTRDQESKTVKVRRLAALLCVPLRLVSDLHLPRRLT